MLHVPQLFLLLFFVLPLCLLKKKPPGSEHLLQRYLDRLGSDVEKEHLPLVVCYSYKDVP